MRAIYFDMDGTIANLFGYDGWLDHLHNSRTIPYSDCTPLVNPTKFCEVLNKLKSNGYTIGVISWGAMDGSVEYTRAVKRAKIEWLNKWFGNVFSEIHVVKYGTPKHAVAKIKNSILVDDNADVRATWKNGFTIDATNCGEMMNALAQLAAWCYNIIVKRDEERSYLLVLQRQKQRLERANVSSHNKETLSPQLS